MKRVVVALLAMLPSLTFGQLSNQGFEEWELRDGVESPVGWANSGYCIMARYESAHTGRYALKFWNWYCSMLVGMAVGESAPATTDLGGIGVPVAFTPTRLSGYYRYELEQGPFDRIVFDSAAVYVLMKRYNAARGEIDTVAFATRLLPPADDWTSFSIDLPLRANDIRPDSIAVVFFTGNPEGNASNSVCAFLSLDDLALRSTSGVAYDLEGLPSPAHVVPNPVRHEPVRIEFDGVPGAAYRIDLFDATGVEVRTASFTGSTFELDPRDLSSGVYYFQIVNAGGLPQARGEFVVEP